jgi:hypothetical protein
MDRQEIRLSMFTFASLPLHEQILDHLAALLFDADEVLGLLQTEEGGVHLWLEPHLRKVYDEVDAVMRQMVD